MRRFNGAGGSLYALGERFSFSSLPLEDCGDGWDWRAPLEFSYWIKDPYIHSDGDHIGVDQFFLGTGRVSLSRNMSRGEVLADGECLPISKVGESDGWEIHQEYSVDDMSGVSSPTRITGTTAVLFDVDDIPIETLMVRLPSGNGLFVGKGYPSRSDRDILIEFSEGVSFGF